MMFETNQEAKSEASPVPTITWHTMFVLVALLSLLFVFVAQWVRASSMPPLGDEFVGPFSNWVNLKTAYGAVGDGMADDTAAIQSALDDMGSAGHRTLYIPAGTYKITGTVTLAYTNPDPQGRYRENLSILGEDPANTIIRWEGPAGGTMVKISGINYSRFNRLTFEGSGTAGIIVDQSNTTGGSFDTGNEYADDFFKNAAIGIQCGGNGANGCSEMSVLRSHFKNLSNVGIIVKNFNALDIWVRHSVFEDNGVGIGNCSQSDQGAGNYHVYNSIFRNSVHADACIANTSPFSFRDNYSIGSNQFVGFGIGTNNPGPLIFQGNTILDTQQSRAIALSGFGPAVFYDNTIRSRFSATSPVVSLGGFNPTASFIALDNTFTVSNPIGVHGSLKEIGTSIVSAGTINPVEPTLPGVEPNMNRPVIELATGATTADIQAAIDTAASTYMGERPVVHFPEGTYSITSTITIPAGSDVQLVGDGGLVTRLNWAGTGSGPVLSIQGPSTATLREMAIHANGTADGIDLQNTDQAGSRVYLQQVNVSGSQNSGLFYDGLDYTKIAFVDSGVGGQNGGVNYRVVGGPLAAVGNGQGGTLALYSGAGGGDQMAANHINVSNGGTLLYRDMWYDGDPNISSGTWAHVTDGILTVENSNVNTNKHDYPTTGPTVDAASLSGKFAIIGSAMDDAIVASGDGSAAAVAAIGTFRNTPPPSSWFINNASPVATMGFIGGQQWANSTQQAVCGCATVTTPDSGLQDDTFITAMLAHTRSEHAPTLSALSSGITDVRMFRMFVRDGVNGIHFNPGGSPPPPASDTVAPSVPSNLSGDGVYSSSAPSAVLNWSSSTDNVGVTNYRVYRNGVHASLTFGAAFTDTGLTPNTTYVYAVRAEDAAGNLSGESTSVSVTTPASPGARVMYSFDECSGTSAGDSSGNGFTGTVFGSPTWSTDSKLATGCSLAFAGGGASYVMTPSLGAAPVNLTLAAWVKPNAAGGVVFSELGQAAANTGWHDSQIEVQTNGTVKYCFWVGWLHCVVGGTIPVGQWSHVAFTYDAAMQTVTGYIDGVQSASDVGAIKQYPSELYYAIGANDGTNGGNGAGFSGFVDDIRVYGLALSASDIAALFAAGNTPPPTAQLSANPTSIIAGETSTLAWFSTDATTCTGSGFATDGAVSGSVSVFPMTTTTYSITCTGAGGSASAETTVTVTPPPPPTVSLTANPASIQTGQSSTLTWESANATSCTGTNFSPSGTSGTTSVTPPTTTTYSITCTGSGGSADASATVTVTTPPPVFGIGVRVQTNSTTPVYPFVGRSWAYCNQPVGALGTITAGPTISGGQKWWRVNFDTKCDGWVRESLLQVVVSSSAPAKKILQKEKNR